MNNYFNTKDLEVKPYESVADSAGLTADWN